jgi:hypothetical protein
MLRLSRDAIEFDLHFAEALHRLGELPLHSRPASV